MSGASSQQALHFALQLQLADFFQQRLEQRVVVVSLGLAPGGMRGYMSQGAGNKLQIFSDQPRSSVFIFDRTHPLPGSVEFTDKPVTSAPNQLRAKFRSLLVPAFGTISSITLPDHGDPLVTCYPDPNTGLSTVCCNAGDYVTIGNTGTNYDREWQVLTPQPGGLTTDANGAPFQFVLLSQGSNYPASWLDSSRPTDAQKQTFVGLSQSRFKERVWVANHRANQYARGAVAAGVPRQPQIVPQEIDYGISTFDQVARLAAYENIRALGADTFSDGAFTAPYVTPKIGRLTAPLFAQDVNGAQAVALQPSDVVTVDSTIDFDYAGDFEIDEPLDMQPYTAKQSGAAMATTPAGGTLTVPLMEYNKAAFVDESNLLGAPTEVPGSDPDTSTYTGVPLADGGSLAFVSGGISSGGVVPLPSGFPATQFLGWTSPQGYVEQGHDLHIIHYEQIDANLQVTLSYTDGEGNVWPGDSSFFICAWVSQTSTTYTNIPNVGQWLTAVLAGTGAEEVLFGWITNYGAGAAGVGEGLPSTIALPSGWEFANVIAVAFPFSNGGSPTGNQCHVMGCSVDGSGNCTFDYKDSSGDTWYGPVQVFVFGYKNNGGTVTDATTSGVRWISIPVGTTDVPLTFRIGTTVLSDQSTSNPAPDNPTTLTLPGGVGGSSLQAIVSPFSFQDDGNPSHGVRALYLDQSLGMNASMEDGEGHIKYGDGTVVAMLCE